MVVMATRPSTQQGGAVPRPLRGGLGARLGVAAAAAAGSGQDVTRLVDLLSDGGGEGHSIRLQPLSSAETLRMALARLGVSAVRENPGGPLQPQLEDVLYRQTKGNPYFAEQLMQVPATIPCLGLCGAPS